MFVKSGGQWQLAGIMVAVAGYSGQPSPELTAVGPLLRNGQPVTE